MCEQNRKAGLLGYMIYILFLFGTYPHRKIAARYASSSYGVQLSSCLASGGWR